MGKTSVSSPLETRTKLDLRKQFKHLYNPSTERVEVVQVPEMQFLMIDGQGNPNTAQEYKDAIEALYSVAYTLKFLIKKEQGIDYPVMPLEGLWWLPDMQAFRIDAKENWLWTMMIMQPEIVTEELFERAMDLATQKKALPALTKIRLESFREGLAAQIMHLGPFAAEGPTISKLHAFIEQQGYEFDGATQKHHEIYLSDPRRVVLEKMKTVIRQPMRELPWLR